ncbi:hypothetical protein ACE38W_14055 [Chitinophaga sp. Hz27]|uniref:lipase family protein n=1 Tax=Chitinophaga sp. Hz27 TaxID=3347169 RepID=UPI0035E04017
MESTNNTLAAAEAATLLTIPPFRLEIIAGQANINGLMTDGPSLPLGYELITTFASDKAPSSEMPVVPSQGYLVKMTVGTVEVDVVTLGVTWLNYFLYQYDGLWTMGNLPSDIANNASTDAKILALYAKAYQYIRKPLWKAVSQRTAPVRPLIICGHGLGAPLAQIAALDLRVGHQGPNDDGGKPQFAPTTVTPCYTFSNAGYASTAFKNYFDDTLKKLNIEVIARRAGTAGNNVDQWPDSPANLVVPGQVVGFDTPLINAADDPWWERATTYYTTALGGQPLPNDPEPIKLPDNPDFSRDFAFAATQMCMMAYHKGQHPDSGYKDPSLSYNFEKSLTSDGGTWAYIFTNNTNNSVVVVFRGTINYTEFNTYAACSVSVTPPWYTQNSPKVHMGAYTIYANMKDTLKTTLQSYSNRDLYFTGHSFGGAIANIAASDYAISSIRNVKAVYTFGSIMGGDYTFAQKFDQVLGSKSFQVKRPKDRIPTGFYEIGYEPFNTGIVMQGEVVAEEPDYHCLLNYKKLLDTSNP